MEDFASAAVMRLVRVGLARQGIERPFDAAEGSRVPIATKRAVLADVMARSGALAILRISAAIEQMTAEPVLIALSASTTPRDLLERWGRLERFSHSRHRIISEKNGSQSIRVRHVSLKLGRAPQTEESLLIFGLLVELMRWIGAAGLRARPAGGTDWSYSAGWRDAPRFGAEAVLEIAWDDIGPRPRVSAETDHDPLERLRALLAQDLNRRWTIASAARVLARSARTLQRQLRRQGTSYSATVRMVRVAAAADLLQTTTMGLDEIGFVCGFADQGHFTRSFKALTATTPRDYRKSFAQVRAIDLSKSANVS